jgi:hypothetical protein
MGFKSIKGGQLLLDGIPIIELSSDNIICSEYEESNFKPLTLGGNITMTCEPTYVNPNLFGNSAKELPKNITIGSAKYKQIRKHKKRRINKKWAKRYGYIKTTTYLDCVNSKVEPKFSDVLETTVYLSADIPQDAIRVEEEIYFGKPK